MRLFSRQFTSFVSVACLVLCGVSLQAWASGPTATTLAVTSGGSTVTTVTAGSVVTLTATVASGSTQVTTGQVNFCDATAKYCTDIHQLGTAQLTANGTATLKFRPGVGSHSYKAVLAEPANLGPSASTASSLTVTAPQGTGQPTTTTYLQVVGAPSTYSLTATVPGNGNVLPTGMVSFQDTSDGNAVLATAALAAETGFGFAGSSLLPVTPPNSSNTVSNTVFTADFNGDGVPDLVVLGSIISVLLGNGDGTFRAAPNPPVDLPGAIAVGDFNGDGIPDVAVAPIVDEGYSEVLLGKGDGTFSTTPSFGNTNGTVASNSLVAGDFNGDGKLDLAETCDTINEGDCDSLLILLGNGDGTFVQSSAISIPISGIQSTALGDFNGDGQLDLAVTDSGSNVVVILPGNGDGTFKNNSCPTTEPTACPATGVGPTSIAVADFNGDGRLDLAVTNSGSNNVTILLGNGDGTFTAAASPATGAAPTSAAVGDFNGDGVPDLAVANDGSSTVTILLGNGDGTFAAAPSPAADTASTAVAAADFNGDGKEDIVVVNSPDRSATALLAETVRASAMVNNISPAGVGTHLVKAVYLGDVNYGGSTSADASLTVLPPGFTLAVTSVTIASPGASGTSTITVTPTNGFSGTVTLECDGDSIPGGANDVPTCSPISPVTISGNAPATTTLTIQTQPGTTPGQYLERVKAADSSGLTIANIPVAVTVTAPPQGLSLTGTPINIASPGASGTSTITLTPSGGFSSKVFLSCAVSGPAGAVDAPTCSPVAPVTFLVNAPVTTTLTIQTQSGTTPGQYTEALQAMNSMGTIVASTNVAVTVTAPPQSFSLSNTPVSIASPGAKGTSTITITPGGGFSSKVMLSCTVSGPAGAVDAPTCLVSVPPPITSSSSVTATLTINTTAASAASAHALPSPLRKVFPIGSVAVAALLFLAPATFRRRWNPWLSLLLFAAFAGAMSGCGGGAMANVPAPPSNPAPPVSPAPPPDPGTAAGSYAVTVTGVSGAITATTTVSVTVN